MLWVVTIYQHYRVHWNMGVEGPYHYRLSMADRKITSIQFEDAQGRMVEVDTFRSPVTRSGLPKLYVVKHRAKIVYVGNTTRGIRERLRYGLSADGAHGYHGYPWKGLDEVDLLIWCLREEPISRAEAIEGELVYLVRNHEGQWPEYQTEIHFHEVTEREKEAAASIYQEALKS